MPSLSPSRRTGHDRPSLYQEITDTVIAQLEQGRVPWVQPWRSDAAPLGLPRNAATGRAYSGINILILSGAVVGGGSTGQSWLTFRQALNQRFSVRALVVDFFCIQAVLQAADAGSLDVARPRSPCLREFPGRAAR